VTASQDRHLRIVPIPAEAPVRIPARRWVLAASLLVLNLGDVVITKSILHSGGVEANPVMKPIMDHPTYPIILKTVVSLIVGVLLLASPADSKVADRAVGLVVFGYLAVMAWNLGILAHG
jgi:hypothetical protein